MPKQAKSSPKTEVPAQAADQAGREKNLFIQVDTYDKAGLQVGHRIVDMYHFGTRKWFQNHNWWAMHNGHYLEITTATPEAVAAHVEEQKQKLAEKFNADRAHVA